MKISKADQERFNESVAKQENNCWLWRGAVDSFQTLYGQFNIKRKRYKAHRIAFAIARKRLPTTHLYHSCGNRLCVNPNHLSEGKK